MDVAAKVVSDHPALAWRRAGLMHITGRSDGPPLVSSLPLTAAADGALGALRALASDHALPANGAVLLGERARLANLSRGGRHSANRSCRLLTTRTDWIALNLPRDDDWTLLPALFQRPADDWAAVTDIASQSDAATLIERGRLLGLAIATVQPPPTKSAPFTVRCARPAAPPVAGRRPRIIDLTALWAGPLAGALLAACGAEVIKVESRQRPDGARRGNVGFFDLLNGMKASVALDFHDSSDLALLRGLVASADIVLEASRPRALARLGIDAEAAIASGATWISITGYGRDGSAGDWIAFGDDAAVAGGVAMAMRHAWGEAMFAGDAIADPLTGITAALAGWAGWRQGGGRLISIALSDVVAHAAMLGAAAPIRAWQRMANADDAPAYAMRSSAIASPPLGADTARLACTAA
ncbi:CoA transferase [Sphingomonas flavalba]|uniref:CoA transferase n=1 Tax=Sphingomonas flavalba TaxID=2559804 RepID=UPI0039E1D51A